MSSKFTKIFFECIVVVVILVAFVFVIGEPIEESFFGIVVIKSLALAVMTYGGITLRKIDKTFDDEDV